MEPSIGDGVNREVAKLIVGVVANVLATAGSPVNVIITPQVIENVLSNPVVSTVFVHAFDIVKQRAIELFTQGNDLNVSTIIQAAPPIQHNAKDQNSLSLPNDLLTIPMESDNISLNHQVTRQDKNKKTNDWEDGVT